MARTTTRKWARPTLVGRVMATDSFKPCRFVSSLISRTDISEWRARDGRWRKNTSSHIHFSQCRAHLIGTRTCVWIKAWRLMFGTAHPNSLCLPSGPRHLSESVGSVLCKRPCCVFRDDVNDMQLQAALADPNGPKGPLRSNVDDPDGRDSSRSFVLFARWDRSFLRTCYFQVWKIPGKRDRYRSSVKLVRVVESFPSVQRWLWEGERDRDFESVQLSQPEKEKMLSERRNLNEYFEKKKRSWTSFSRIICSSDEIIRSAGWIGQKRMVKEKCSCCSLWKTNRWLESQRIGALWGEPIDWSNSKGEGLAKRFRNEKQNFSGRSCRKEIVKKMKKYKECAVQKLEELGTWGVMNLLYLRNRIFPQWNSFSLWFRFRICKTWWIPWTTQKNSMILKQRAALNYPTFPVNPWVFWDFEERQAAMLACSPKHGIHYTFLKVCLLKVNRPQRSSRIQRIWHRQREGF